MTLEVNRPLILMETKRASFCRLEGSLISSTQKIIEYSVTYGLTTNIYGIVSSMKIS